jgi:hypothetical protein
MVRLMCAPPEENLKPNASSAAKGNGNFEDKAMPLDIVTYSSFGALKTLSKAFIRSGTSGLVWARQIYVHERSLKAQTVIAPNVGKFIIGYSG